MKNSKFLLTLLTCVAIIGILAVAIASISYNIFLFPLKNNSNRAEGVESLTVPLKNDLNYSIVPVIANNLTSSGYKPTIGGKNAFSEWYLEVIWRIPDDSYGKTYGYNITVTLFGFNQSDNATRSFIKAEFTPSSTSTDPAKKVKDKEFSKQAIYAIVAIMNIDLDWERHIYVIAWMTMTSEGVYEEK
jgi:hypothetical protein